MHLIGAKPHNSPKLCLPEFCAIEATVTQTGFGHDNDARWCTGIAFDAVFYYRRPGRHKVGEVAAFASTHESPDYFEPTRF